MKNPRWLIGLVTLAVALELAVLIGTRVVEGDVTSALRYFTIEQIELGREHLRFPRLLGAIESVGYVAITLWLALSSGGARLVDSIARRARGDWRTLVALVALVVAWTTLWSLPFDILRRRHELDWGLTAQTWGDWVGQAALAFSIGAGAQLVLAFILYGFLRRAPKRGFVLMGALAALFTVGANALWPVVIAPLFNEVVPIAATKWAALEPELRAVAAAAGLGDVPLFVVDASRQGGGANAYVAGMFGHERIVLYDILLEHHDLDGVKSTLAHELGHWKLHHVAWGTAIGAASAFASVGLLWLALGWLIGKTPLELRAKGDPRGYLLIVAMSWASATIVDPIASGLTRRQEIAADVFAVELTKNVRSWAVDERRYVLERYGDPVPHPLRELLSTHPHVVWRIERACRVEPKACDDLSLAFTSSRVEVKVALDPTDEEKLKNALGMKGAGEKMLIGFFDTPELALFQRGVILRARRIKNDPDETTVKLRGDAAAHVSSAWEGRMGFKREIDRSDGRDSPSVSLTLRAPKGKLARLIHGLAPRDLFAVPQRKLAGAVPWEKIVALEPIHARRFEAERAGLELDLERWELNEGGVILELSTKVDAQDVARAEATLSSLLEEAGVTPRATVSKTEAALRSARPMRAAR